MSSVKLVSHRTNLSRILQFACGYCPSAFRVDVDFIDDTMFFARWKTRNYQVEPPNSSRPCWGDEFPKAVLTADSDMQGSVSHSLIVQYTLGGMKCMIKFEGNAYIEEDSSLLSATGPSAQPKERRNGPLSVNELLQQMRSGLGSEYGRVSEAGKLDQEI